MILVYNHFCDWKSPVFIIAPIGKTDREKEIIQMFFGIGQQEMTLEEIGDKFGLTRERVRQIKEKAIRRLRQSNRSKLLKSYLG